MPVKWGNTKAVVYDAKVGEVPILSVRSTLSRINKFKTLLLGRGDSQYYCYHLARGKLFDVWNGQNVVFFLLKHKTAHIVGALRGICPTNLYFVCISRRKKAYISYYYRFLLF